MDKEIKNISIIGLGLIGGSIAKGLKEAELSLELTAFDTGEVLAKALEEGTINGRLASIQDALASDVIFLCLPVELSLQYLKELAPLLKEGQIISDVCGVKGRFQTEWQKLNSAGNYFGGHPMTGKEKGGYDNSDLLLFENSVYIFSNRYKDSELMPGFVKIIESLGARITMLDPYLHDRVVANVSHLPQILSVSLVNSAAKKENGTNFTDFAAGGFRDMTRIASSDFSIWEKVIQYNKEEILNAVKFLKNEITKMEDYIEENNVECLAHAFEDSRKKRDEVPKDTKGFINQLYDIYIFVTDKPGVISKISTALFKNNIDIKDIELLKIREGTGGTFRLSLDVEKDVERAKDIIRAEGFEVR